VCLIAAPYVFVHIPNAPVRLVGGHVEQLDADLAKQAPGCQLSITSEDCRRSWADLGVPGRVLDQIDRRDNLQLGLIGAGLPFAALLLVSGFRRFKDSDVNLETPSLIFLPLVFVYLAILYVRLLWAPSHPIENAFGPVPDRGFDWRALYGGRKKIIRETSLT
jgi:hypothetical protein